MKRWKLIRTCHHGPMFWRLKPQLHVTYYRWRWLARLRAFIGNIPPIGVNPYLYGWMEYTVEEARPRWDNVVELRRSA